jgi:hypothetical protein
MGCAPSSAKVGLQQGSAATVLESLSTVARPNVPLPPRPGDCDLVFTVNHVIDSRHLNALVECRCVYNRGFTRGRGTRPSVYG